MKIHHEKHQALTEATRTRSVHRVSDPCAVEARIRTGASDETVRTFARELIGDGSERGAGQGDVTVWPEEPLLRRSRWARVRGRRPRSVIRWPAGHGSGPHAQLVGVEFI
ncbi:SsgA family sporulation/cell division regulator [Streptomyces sp. TG1A-8]|uniref:SsgA family sporulation/cell division regulator n=1 Tax=Streptomyces sp. TG1A-8 TaxID=3051385 RepID=UPI003463DCDA